MVVNREAMRRKSYERAPLTTDPLEDSVCRMGVRTGLVSESSPAQTKSLPFRYTRHTTRTHPTRHPRLSSLPSAAFQPKSQMSNPKAQSDTIPHLLRPSFSTMPDDDFLSTPQSRICPFHSYTHSTNHRSADRSSNNGTPRRAYQRRLWPCDPFSAAKSRAESEYAVHFHRSAAQVCPSQVRISYSYLFSH